MSSLKPINDNFGHQKGDQVLRDLADIFREAVRDTDIVAQYGGDELLVAVRGTSFTEARSMCHRESAEYRSVTRRANREGVNSSR